MNDERLFGTLVLRGLKVIIYLLVHKYDKECERQANNFLLITKNIGGQP